MHDFQEILKLNGLDGLTSGNLDIQTPIDGSKIASVSMDKSSDVDDVIQKSKAAFLEWRKTPPPVRGELVRLLGEELRAAKETLGALVTLECGKILSEGGGEVQEMIDMATQKIFEKAVKRFQAAGNKCPDNLSQLLIGEADVGEALVEHKDIPV